MSGRGFIKYKKDMHQRYVDFEKARIRKEQERKVIAAEREARKRISEVSNRTSETLVESEISLSKNEIFNK